MNIEAFMANCLWWCSFIKASAKWMNINVTQQISDQASVCSVWSSSCKSAALTLRLIWSPADSHTKAWRMKSSNTLLLADDMKYFTAFIQPLTIEISPLHARDSRSLSWYKRLLSFAFETPLEDNSVVHH